MPEIDVLLFREGGDVVPLLHWLDGLPEKVQNKCIVRIERLAQQGHLLRRPEAALLRDGVYELRVRHQHVNYRMLYFFHQGRAVLSHGITKERRVPDREIDLAVRRRVQFAHDPGRHTYREEV